jgi:anti-anti-sigma factor
MPTIKAQIWKGSPFTIQREEGKTPNTAIFHFNGPFTARDMYRSLTPDALSNMLDPPSAWHDGPPPLNILDITHVPYMDSAGLGIIVRYFVRSRSKGVRLIVAGAGPRIVELFKMTKVDGLIPMTATIEEAETR